MRADRAARRRFSLWMLPVVLAGAVAGCRSAPPLAHAERSASALASLVLDAIARRDQATLQGLALDEAEFRAHVWPALPAARPERNLPFSYVWGELRQKSASSLASTLARLGGRQSQLIDVQFAERPTEYAGYRVHRGSAFVVRDDLGAEETLRVCGSLLEKDCVWKVFSYVVDD